MDQGKLIIVYTGTELTVQLLKKELEDIGIESMIRNDFQSGVTAGFSGGVPSSVDLYIDENDLEKANPVVNHFLLVNE